MSKDAELPDALKDRWPEATRDTVQWGYRYGYRMGRLEGTLPYKLAGIALLTVSCLVAVAYLMNGRSGG